MSNCTRQKSNSLTHLCKILAKEVFYEELKSERASYEFERLGFSTSHVGVNSIREAFALPIQNELKSAGAKWSKQEDCLLEEEIELALKSIAASHGRTKGSIRSRIHQKELL